MKRGQSLDISVNDNFFYFLCEDKAPQGRVKSLQGLIFEKMVVNTAHIVYLNQTIIDNHPIFLRNIV